VVRHPLVARIVDAYDAQGSAAMRAGVNTRRKPLPTDD
jgi:phosphate starvation-inducible PhoH-like protein